MKRLAIVILVAAAAYSGYWFWSASNMQNGIETWFVDRNADGWRASYDTLDVRGFPNRTDATLTDLDLQNAGGGWEWNAPFFQILALSYKKGHEILVWPNSQTLRTGDRTWEVASEGLRASIVHDGARIDRTNLEADILNMSSKDRTVALAGLNVALAKQLAENTYRLAVTADAIALSDPIVSGSAAPESIDALRIDMTVTLDNTLTTTGAAAQPTAIDLRLAEYGYGSLTIKSAGKLDIGHNGKATGDLTLRADNWRTVLDQATDQGQIPPTLADGAREILGLISRLDGKPDTLDVTLTIDEGRTYLGPIPIGPFPDIRFP